MRIGDAGPDSVRSGVYASARRQEFSATWKFEVPQAGASLALPYPNPCVKLALFVRICQTIGTYSENLCSSRPIFTGVPSAFQRFQPMNSMEHLVCPHGNQGRGKGWQIGCVRGGEAPQAEQLGIGSGPSATRRAVRTTFGERIKKISSTFQPILLLE